MQYPQLAAQPFNNAPPPQYPPGPLQFQQGLRIPARPLPRQFSQQYAPYQSRPTQPFTQRNQPPPAHQYPGLGPIINPHAPVLDRPVMAQGPIINPQGAVLGAVMPQGPIKNPQGPVMGMMLPQGPAPNQQGPALNPQGPPLPLPNGQPAPSLGLFPPMQTKSQF
jgi:hypothetical protein